MALAKLVFTTPTASGEAALIKSRIEVAVKGHMEEFTRLEKLAHNEFMGEQDRVSSAARAMKHLRHAMELEAALVEHLKRLE